MTPSEAIKIMDFNLSEEATEESLKKQFRKMVLKYHPDKNKGDSSKFLQVKEAYDILLKELKRRNSPTLIEFPFNMQFYQGSPTSNTGTSFTWTFSNG